MDGSQFDAWTRRGFGAAAGGLAGSLLAMSALPGAEAAKKKKKKRCKKLGKACNNGKKKCCCGYECREVLNNNGGRHCCRAADFPASSPEDCCSGHLQLGRCICKTLGQICDGNQACCSGSCVSGMSGFRCVDPTAP